MSVSLHSKVSCRARALAREVGCYEGVFRFINVATRRNVLWQCHKGELIEVAGKKQ